LGREVSVGLPRVRDEALRDILHVISVTTLASLLTGLNARLAVVGLPDVASVLRADVMQVFWISQGYMLGSTVVQLIIGRLADLYGRVRIFNLGFLVFAFGGLAAGLASNPHQVIVARVAQGVGGGLMSLSTAILADHVPRERLATWLGVNRMAWRFGAVVGLTLSGFIIDYLGWRWIFLINVPLGFAFYVWSLMRLEEVYRPVEEAKIDWAGFALLTGSITALLLGLTLAQYRMLKGMSLLLYAASAVLLAVFVPVELGEESPILDLRIFNNWQFTGGIIAQTLYALALGASMILASIYLQVVEGLPASLTGLYLLPYEVSYLIFGVVGGRLSDIFGYSTVSTVGLVAASYALYRLSSIVSTITGNPSSIIAPLIIYGFGAGLFTAPNTSSILSAVPPHRRGIASAVTTLVFNVGFTASLNLAVFSMTHHIPYEIASSLISGSVPTSINPASTYVEQLAKGISLSLLVQSIFMASAIPFSLSRIRLRRDAGETPRSY